jgi:hypothetical protein
MNGGIGRLRREDVAAGKLDALIAKAEADIAANNVRELRGQR